MAPLKRDNEDERFARIEALIEEYRINHEDLEAYVRKARVLARRRHQQSQRGLRDAREAFELSKQRAAARDSRRR